jgi:hypothetical protein
VSGGSGTEIAAKVYLSWDAGIVPGTEVLGQIKVKGTVQYKGLAQVNIKIRM